MLDSFIRCRPEDGTNGFFVACFVRKPSKGPNPLKRKAEEELDDLIAVRDEILGSEEYEEWHGITGDGTGPAVQSAKARKQKRKKKARPVE
jgi:25S rRNA (cytosine2278-C5)-methyltransferase